MYGCMISYVYEYGCIYDYMVVWVHEYMCYICVVLYEIVSVWLLVIMALCDAMISVWYIHDIYMCDMILCYMCYDLIMALYIRILCTLQDWNLYVVLNTTCSCIRYYVMWILILWIIVIVTVFKLLYLQHFLRTFLKYCIFACFHALSLAISYLLLFSHFFIIS